MEKVLLLFDLDGTLTRTFYSEDNSLMTTLSQTLPVDVNSRYWETCPHLTDGYVFDMVFTTYSQRPALLCETLNFRERFLDTLRKKRLNTPDFFLEIPGAVNLLKALIAHPIYEPAIVTGSWAKVARFKLEQAGFLQEQIPVIGSDRFPTKTEAIGQMMDFFFRKHRKKMPALYIGDSLYDRRSALEAGIPFLGIDFRNRGIFNQLENQVWVPNFLQPDTFLETVRSCLVQNLKV